MKFIFTVLLIYFLFRLISRLILSSLTHKVEKQTMSGEGYANKKAADPKKNKKKKIFKQDDGDYVDFEELEK